MDPSPLWPRGLRRRWEGPWAPGPRRRGRRGLGLGVALGLGCLGSLAAALQAPQLLHSLARGGLASQLLPSGAAWRSRRAASAARPRCGPAAPAVNCTEPAAESVAESLEQSEEDEREDERELLETFRTYFGHEELRPKQLEVLLQVLQFRDSVVLWASGAGKSLCFQLLAVYLNATVVVVEPLVAVMQDQVASFNARVGGRAAPGCRDRRFRACFLGGGQPDPEVEPAALSGEYCLVYVTPEKFIWKLDAFVGLHNGRRGPMILAVDEAHCISEWGLNFRPEFRELLYIREDCPDVMIMALTSIKSPLVVKDIVQYLQLRDPFKSVDTLYRKNLRLSRKLLPKAKKEAAELVASAIKDNPGSAIVYVPRKKTAEELALALKDLLPELAVAYYHADMDGRSRKFTIKEFESGRRDVVVATIALGMGVDLKDLRNVINFGAPGTMEMYYQEIGRAGRDDLPANCLLLSAENEFENRPAEDEEWELRSNVAIRDFGARGRCRWRGLLEYFGERPAFERCGTCDNCRRRAEDAPEGLEEAMRIALEVMKACALRLETLRGLLDVCAGRWKAPPFPVARIVRPIRELMPAAKERCARLGPRTRWEPMLREVVGFLCSEGYAERKVRLTGRWQKLSTRYNVTAKGLRWLGAGAPEPGPVPHSLRRLLEDLARPKQQPALRELSSGEELLAMGPEGLQALTYRELQRHLSARMRPGQGKKADLVARLWEVLLREKEVRRGKGKG